MKSESKKSILMQKLSTPFVWKKQADIISSSLHPFSVRIPKSQVARSFKANMIRRFGKASNIAKPILSAT